MALRQIIALFVSACALSHAQEETCAAGEDCGASLGSNMLQSRVELERAEGRPSLKDGGVDLPTPDHVYSPDSEVPDNRSKDEKLADLRKAFEVYDKDGSGELCESEVQQSMFAHKLQDMESMEKGDDSVNETADKLGATDDEAKEFIEANDKDKSGCLGMQEFLDSMADDSAPTNASKVLLVETVSIIGCLKEMKISKMIPNGCVKKVNVKSCFRTFWDIFNPNNWKCAWKQITKLFDCVKEFFEKVGASCGECFVNVIDEASKSKENTALLQGYGSFDLGIDLKPLFGKLKEQCSSIENCGKVFTNAGPLLESTLHDIVKKKFDDLLGSGPLGKGIKFAGTAINKMPEALQDQEAPVNRVASAMDGFVTGKLKTVHPFTEEIDMCATNNNGLINLGATDCGSMDALKDLMGNILDIGGIGGRFNKIVDSVKTCITRKGLLEIPTPFLNLDAPKYCLPDDLKQPMKDVVGAFMHYASHLSKAGSSCAKLDKGDNEAVCKAVEDIKTIGTSLSSVFDISDLVLLELNRGQGRLVHSASYLTGGGEGCKDDSDFTVFVETGKPIILKGKSYMMSFELMSGCKKKAAFNELSIGFAENEDMIKKISDIWNQVKEGAKDLQKSAADAAKNLKPALDEQEASTASEKDGGGEQDSGEPAEKKAAAGGAASQAASQEGFFSLGFEQGGEGEDSVGWDTYFKIQGGFDLKPTLPLVAPKGSELAFKLNMKKVGAPLGFKIKMPNSALASIKKTVADVKGKVDAAIKDVAKQQLKNVQLTQEQALEEQAARAEEAAREAYLIREWGVSSMANVHKRAQEDHKVVRFNLPVSLKTGVEVKFCLTCHLWDEATKKGIIGAPPANVILDACGLKEDSGIETGGLKTEVIKSVQQNYMCCNKCKAKAQADPPCVAFEHVAKDEQCTLYLGEEKPKMVKKDGTDAGIVSWR